MALHEEETNYQAGLCITIAEQLENHPDWESVFTCSKSQCVCATDDWVSLLDEMDRLAVLCTILGLPNEIPRVYPAKSLLYLILRSLRVLVSPRLIVVLFPLVCSSLAHFLLVFIARRVFISRMMRTRSFSIIIGPSSKLIHVVALATVKWCGSLPKMNNYSIRYSSSSSTILSNPAILLQPLYFGRILFDAISHLLTDYTPI